MKQAFNDVRLGLSKIAGLVKFTTGKGKTTLAAGNGEAQIEASIELGLPKGSFAVDGRVIDLIRALPDEKIDFEVDGKTLVVRHEVGRYRFTTQAADIVASMHEPDYAVDLTVQSEQLRKLLDFVVPAADEDNVRHFLNGVCLDIGGRSLTLTASEGHLMGTASVEIAPTESSVRTIVPTRTARDLARMLSNAGETVRVRFGGTMVRFDFGDRSLISKVIASAYPSMDTVVEHHRAEAYVTLNAAAVDAALSRLAITCDLKGAPGIRLQLANSKVALESASMAERSGVESFAAEIPGKVEGLEIGIALKYAQRAVAAARVFAETLEIGASSVERGIVFRPRDDEGNTAGFWIVMPMRT